ncbi:hypothetical protein ACYF6T_06510 [Streptomyces sp. 7R007]
MRERGQRSVSAGGDIALAVTGDNNRITAAPAVRSAYWEHVRLIAPARLDDREDELDALAAFCTADSGPAYAWWRAGAWAGKTALLSWFALNPPPDVCLVPFFVTARLAAQNDVVAYVDVVLEQLAELIGEGLPAYLTEATREAHLRRMYREAARACAGRGRRLVLIVDGLDEDRGVTTRSDSHSIASLLPGRLEHGMRVVVASRLHPPLPADVPPDHPLRHAEAVLLRRSPAAQVIRTDADRQLKRLTEAGGLEHDLLALVTAAGGGLAVPDLTALTGGTRVREVLCARAGQVFAVRGDVYLLAHEELQAQAEDLLGPAELARHRGRLHAWADEWRDRGWPGSTPEYLLRGYFPLLRATGDLDRMVACALDAPRHERMLDVTGGDAAALDEIRAAQEALVERGGQADLTTALRLAMHRDELAGRSARIAHAVAAAWAVLGQVNRAQALAYSKADPEDRAEALMAVAGRLAAAGETERALVLLTDAQVSAGLIGKADDRERTTQRLCLALIEAGQCARATRLLESLSPPYAHDVLLPLVRRHLAEERYEPAWQAADRVTAPEDRAVAFGELAAARLRRGAVQEAESAFRAGGSRAWALVALASASGPENAGRLLDEAVEAVEADLAAAGPQSPWAVVEALVDAGEVGRATALAGRLPEAVGRVVARDRAYAKLVRAEAERGEFERARAWLDRIVEPGPGDEALADLAAQLACRGRLREAERLLLTADGEHAAEWAQARIAEVAAAQGDLLHAADRADDLLHGPARARVMVALAEAGARLDRVDTAVALARGIADYPFMDGSMARVALTLALRGQARAAEELLRELEAEARGPVSELGDLLRLADALKALDRAGYGGEAAAVVASEPATLARLEVLVWHDNDFAADLCLMAGCEVLAGAGEFDRLEAMLDEAPGHLAVLFPLAEALADTGQTERAAALLDGCTDGLGVDAVRAAVARGLVLKGDVPSALAAVRETEGPRERTATLARLAQVAAYTERHDAARTLLRAAAEAADDTDGPETWHAAASVVEALVALGQVDAARDRLDAALFDEDARIPLDEVPGYVRLLALVGRPEAAEGVADAIEDTATRAGARAEVVKALAEAGEYGRAERLARRILPDESTAGAALAEIARFADEPTARALVVQALRHVSWTQALPALLRLEPRTVPVVVAALSGPVTPDPTATATWRSPIGMDRPTAARTSAPSAS